MTAANSKSTSSVGVAAGIYAARKSKGWTQRELGAAAAFHPSHISDFEHGRRQPSLTSAIRLADALGASLDGLVGRERPVPEASRASDTRSRDLFREVLLYERFLEICTHGNGDTGHCEGCAADAVETAAKIVYKSPVEGFRALAKAAGGRWDGVDADEYVRRLRGDDEADDRTESSNKNPGACAQEAARGASSEQGRDRPHPALSTRTKRAYTPPKGEG